MINTKDFNVSIPYQVKLPLIISMYNDNIHEAGVYLTNNLSKITTLLIKDNEEKFGTVLIDLLQTNIMSKEEIQRYIRYAEKCHSNRAKGTLLRYINEVENK